MPELLLGTGGTAPSNNIATITQETERGSVHDIITALMELFKHCQMERSSCCVTKFFLCLLAWMPTREGKYRKKGLKSHISVNDLVCSQNSNI